MAEGRKKLYRSRDERWIAGVCGGIGEYFDVDPTVIRVIFVLSSFIFGGGLWIYLILWVIIPLNKADFYPSEMISTDEPPVEEIIVEETPEEEDE
jgi:phage shock protein C